MLSCLRRADGDYGRTRTASWWRRVPCTKRYANGPLGLVQGFTVAATSRHTNGPLTNGPLTNGPLNGQPSISRARKRCVSAERGEVKICAGGPLSTMRPSCR
jgi:hypothetical protein